MRKKFTLGNALLSACCLSSLSLHAQTADRPNIILFLVDDMGWQDTSVPFYNDSVMPLNRRYHTPNMERLAEAGVRFTQAYACPISTPTRCSLMSGMNAARHRVTNWTLDYDKRTDAERGDIVPPEWNYNGIQPDTVTSTHDRKNTTLITGLPEILRRNGYYTIHCGKAHFGAISTTGADPSAFGFEVNIGGGANGAPGSYLGTRNFGQGKWAVKGLEKYHGQDIFLSEALTREALSALEKPIAEKKPFYLYMSHYAVHAPYDEDKRFSGKYRNRYDEQLKDTLNEMEIHYAALVEGMDKSLGDILDFLQKRPEVASNTILLFMSDNGGQALNNVRQGKANRDQNYPARAGKGSAFMGGVREPMMVCWPGVTEKNTTNDNPVMIEDFFPTILEMAGISGYTTSQTVDGKSFVHLLKNPDEKRERPILWHFPNLWGETQNKEEGYGTFSAYLKGNYHLIYHWENRKLRLYNIKEDISEQNDLSAQYPDIVKVLAKEMTDELKRCKAQRPSLKTTGKRIAYPDGSL